MRWCSVFAIGGCVLVVMPVGWFTLVPSFGFGSLVTPPDHASVSEPSVAQQTEVLFLGDVLLARDVERRIRRVGLDHPYQGFPIASTSFAVINFESSVPPAHQPTPDGHVRFSTARDLLPPARAAGITHANLANNHTLDHGAVGLANTRTVLARTDIIPFGDPQQLGASSIAYLDIRGGTVAIIGIHAVWSVPSIEVLARTFTHASARSDVQVAFVHWGPEYRSVASPAQRTLARQLVRVGADLVIGHHPHVVQDVDVVEGVPVFYSLGNFIFDQYFSPSVQTGLALRLMLEPTPKIEVVPVSSAETLIQPRPLEGEARRQFLSALAKRSHPALTSALALGELSFPLATSSEIVMIGTI